MNRKVVGLVACLLPLVFSGVLASTSNEAHHINDAPDCKVLIEHHCASSHTEAEVEACLMAWYEEHHGKHDADEAELSEHHHCAELIEELEHEAGH